MNGMNQNIQRARESREKKLKAINEANRIFAYNLCSKSERDTKAHSFVYRLFNKFKSQL